MDNLLQKEQHIQSTGTVDYSVSDIPVQRDNEPLGAADIVRAYLCAVPHYDKREKLHTAKYK